MKEIPVFARTNLGTRIVIAVSPETTVGDFKSESALFILEFRFFFLILLVAHARIKILSFFISVL